MTVPRFTSPVAPRPVGTPTPRRQETQSLNIPAPVGMDAMSPLASLQPDRCPYTYNLMPHEIGLRTRKGYREWANSFPGTVVRTIVPFHGDNMQNDKLFALTSAGIYDITTIGTDNVAPTQVLAWGTTGDRAGYAVYAHFTNDAGEHYLLLADERNGYHIYTESTGLWTKVADGSITGGPATLASDTRFIVVHKGRVWLFPENASVGYYLNTSAITGAATVFNFGANFREGGYLVGAYSWTVDGGDGVDDYLVVVSKQGAVTIYRGNDPATASLWSLVGVWYIGRVPLGRRIGSQYGSTLYLIGEKGLLNVNTLLEGRTYQESAIRATDEITRLVRENLLNSIDQRGWEIISVPQENLWLVNAPENEAQGSISYVRNLTTQGWGLWRSVPMSTGDVFNGVLYFADDQGSVWQYNGTLDGVTLNQDPNAAGRPYNPGSDIEFSMLTSFQGDPHFKRCQLARPYFLSTSLPSFAVQARYDYDLTESDKTLTFVPTAAAEWDSGIWDSATWGAGLSPAQTSRGLLGLGHYVAIALRGRTQTELTLLGIDVQYEVGGLL